MLYYPWGYGLTLLQVEQRTPYLPQGTASIVLSGEGAEVDDTLEAVGLRQWHGKLALDLDVEVQESAAPAVLIDEERAAEMGMSQADVIKELGDDTVVVSVGFDANDGGATPPPPAAEFQRPPRPTRWKAPYSKCITCAPIPGREPGTCRWYGESAVGAPAIDSEVAPPAAGDGEPVSDDFVADNGSPLADADEMQPGRMSKAEEAHIELLPRNAGAC